MRNFFKSVLANIVAFFIIGFVGFLSLILIIVIASMSGQQEESANLTKNSVLTLDLKTNIIDGPAEDNVSFLNFKQPKYYVKFFEKYRDLKLPVRIIIVDKYQVILNMLCRYNFTYSFRDKAGDVPYTLDIKEYILPGEADNNV